MGCNVLTLPSRISGNPVWLLTSMTSTPALRNEFAVPPVDKISMPNELRNLASSIIPSLLLTDNNARRILTRSSLSPAMIVHPHQRSGEISSNCGPCYSTCHTRNDMRHSKSRDPSKILQVLWLYPKSPFKILNANKYEQLVVC